MSVRRAWLGVAAMAAAAAATHAATSGNWCLGFGSLGPVRAGMSVDQVLSLPELRGLPRPPRGGDCAYLRHRAGGTQFDLMIINGVVVRIELKEDSALRTISGAHAGSSEQELRALYGARLEMQPHKYDPEGHVFVLQSSNGANGLRFETSHGKVTAIQSGPWEHLHYVEGCG